MKRHFFQFCASISHWVSLSLMDCGLYLYHYHSPSALYGGFPPTFFSFRRQALPFTVICLVKETVKYDANNRILKCGHNKYNVKLPTVIVARPFSFLLFFPRCKMIKASYSYTGMVVESFYFLGILQCI